MSKESRRILIQIALFIATFICTTLAGNEWSYGRSIFFTADYGWHDFVNGLSYSIPLLLILTAHEFGHYFLALFHKVKSSLPYYIPVPPIPGLGFSFGTLGAVIRLRSRPYSNVQNFDIGLAGPLAGFVVALVILVYGFVTLPPPEYVYQFHPEYEQFGVNYADTVYTAEFRKREKERLLKELKRDISAGKIQNAPDTATLTVDHINIADVKLGNNLAFLVLGKLFADPARVPNPHELMHYPVLLACYIALFITALNLLPIGQLDGGHVVYGLFGFKSHRIIAISFFVALMFYAGLGSSLISLSQPKEQLAMWLIVYVLIVFFAFKGLQLSTRDTWMYALLLVAVQLTLMMLVPGIKGYEGWLFFAFIIGRFFGIYHPRSEIEVPLDSKRIILGWITLLIFILCFSPAPIVIE
ncbi:MAG TPA: site-2 protease family protein [Chryseosolibacter sp.]